MCVQARGVAPDDSPSMYTLHVGDIDRFMRRTWTVLEIAPEDFHMAMRGWDIVVGISTYEDDRVRLIHA